MDRHLVSLHECIFKLIVHLNRIFFSKLYCLWGNVTLVCFSKLRIDNSKCKVEQKERTNKNQWYKIKKDNFCISLLHITLDITPTFKSNWLEYTKKRVHDTVEVCYTVVWVFVCLSAEISSWACRTRSAKWWIIGFNSSLDVDAPLFESTLHQVSTSNSHDREEKH